MTKISIITITYNNINGLRKTVESVICQEDYSSIEYIIIDGASSDGTVEYLNTLPTEIKWISEVDRGISHAFNKGIKRATGDSIIFLNSGDELVDRFVISKAIKKWENSKVDLLSFRVQVTDNIYIPCDDNENKIKETCDMPHQGTFISRELCESVGGYSEEYRIRMDYHFFAKCKKNGATFKYIPEVIVKYEPGGVSMKKENRVRFWKEGMSVKYMYGLPIVFKDIIKTFIFYNK